MLITNTGQMATEIGCFSSSFMALIKYLFLLKQFYNLRSVETAIENFHSRELLLVPFEVRLTTSMECIVRLLAIMQFSTDQDGRLRLPIDDLWRKPNKFRSHYDDS